MLFLKRLAPLVVVGLVIVVVLLAIRTIGTSKAKRDDMAGLAHPGQGSTGPDTATTVGGHPAVSTDPPKLAPRGSGASEPGSGVAATRIPAVVRSGKAGGSVLPATIEGAIAVNPALAADLACRDPQANFNMDYTLRLIGGVRDCLDGRTSSKGKIVFMFHFDVDPANRRGVWRDLEPQSSDLSPEDDEIVLSCVRTYAAGTTIGISEKYGHGEVFHSGLTFNLPLEDSFIFRMVREGSYTAGTNFGCDVP